jgi:hypothetical protein
MAEKLGEALLDLDTRDKGFKKGIAAAEKDARGFGGSLDNLSAKAIAMGRTLAGGVAGGVAAFGLAVAKTSREIAQMAAEAKTAGLSVKEFQQLRYVADQNLVSIGALTDGIKELNLRADEFIYTGQGSASESFKRLGYDAEELKAKLQDPADLFLDIIRRVEQLDQAAQIRVLDEVFGGTGGEQFARFLAAGADNLEKSIDRASELGQVLNDEVVNKAVELDQAINVASTSVGTALQTAIVDAGWALYDFTQQFWAFSDRSSGSLKSQSLDLAKERQRLEAEIAGKRTDALDNLGLSPAIASGTADYVTRTGLEDARKSLADVISKEREINAILKEREPVKPELRSTTPGAGASTGSGKGKSSTEASQIDQLIASLKGERDVLRELDPVQQRMILLRREMTDATPKQTVVVRDLITTIEQERAAWESAQDMGQFFGNTALSSIEALRKGSKDLVGVLDDVIDSLAQAVLQSMLLGQGPLAGAFGTKGADGGIGGIFGMLGSLFGGFHANGGIIPNGTFGIVGERGPEPVIASSRGAMVLPNSSLTSALGGGGGQVFNVTINGSNLSQSEMTQALRDAFDHYSRFELPSRIDAHNRDPLVRG